MEDSYENMACKEDDDFEEAEASRKTEIVNKESLKEVEKKAEAIEEVESFLEADFCNKKVCHNSS